MIVLAPASVQEMAELTIRGFELADKYRMTAMILADGTIGQMMEPVSLDFDVKEAPAKPWATTGTKMQREHNIANSLYLSPEVLEIKNFERYEKYAQICEKEAIAEEYLLDDAEIVIRYRGPRIQKCGQRSQGRGNQGRTYPPDHPVAVPGEDLQEDYRQG